MAAVGFDVASRVDAFDARTRRTPARVARPSPNIARGARPLFERSEAMPHSRVLLGVLVCLAPLTRVAVQVPAGLRAAIAARDSAIIRGDAATWDRLTASTFTVVGQDGSMLTKAERLALMKSQGGMPPWTRSREVAHRYGDVFVVRFFANSEWFLEVWVMEEGQWKSAATQVTFAKK